MKTHLGILACVVAGALAAGACASSSASPSTPAPAITAPSAPSPEATETDAAPAVVATPYASAPAAGICAEPTEGIMASVEIWPDVPSPRCLKIKPQQRVQVINKTGAELLIELGSFQVSLQPGGVYLLDQPVESYLAPGVHRLQTSPFGGPELWLEN